MCWIDVDDDDVGDTGILFVGGGVLAHTILGVDFNDQSGNIRSVK